jgi:hypothetical protein
LKYKRNTIPYTISHVGTTLPPVQIRKNQNARKNQIKKSDFFISLSPQLMSEITNPPRVRIGVLIRKDGKVLL